jgi:hypothetical protein
MSPDLRASIAMRARPSAALCLYNPRPPFPLPLLPPTCSVRPLDDASPNPVHDWQRTDTYIAPNFEAYSPTTRKGGEELDGLTRALRRDERPADEIYQTVRRRLHRSGPPNSLEILRRIGNRFVWNKDPQDPAIIEIMYHASDGDKYGTTHWAVYFGLSVVKHKAPAILRALADVCMRVDDPNVLDRVAWGCSSQRGEHLTYLKPYLDSADSKTVEKARVVEKILKGELQAFIWARDQAIARAEREFKQELPEIKQKLLTG